MSSGLFRKCAVKCELTQSQSESSVIFQQSFQMKELRTLLNENYMEEDDNSIRYDFSQEYLQW